MAGSGPNLYAYVGNNPINLRDPVGLNTVQIGVSFSFTVGGFGDTVFAGFAFDGQGNSGYDYGGGGSAATAVGASFSGGVSVASSTATNISGLAGPFANWSFGGGEGAYGAVDAFADNSPSGPVVGTGGTFGGGFGASVSGSATDTCVHTFGRKTTCGNQ